MLQHLRRALRAAPLIAVAASVAAAAPAHAGFGTTGGALTASPTPNATVAPPPILPPPRASTVAHSRPVPTAALHASGTRGLLTPSEFGFAGVVLLAGTAGLAGRRRALRRSAS